MNSPRFLLPGSLQSRAFTLVEVTIAVGVMSFCLLTTIGLLPVAVTTMQSAMENTISSQIMQKISSEATLTKFAELDTYVNNGPYYFDYNGQLTTKTEDRRFKVSLERMTSEKLSPFPGSQEANALPNSLYVIKSVVTDARMAKDSLPLTYILYVPNSGG